ncbi:lasso peptide biosynthesis B2 protein [Mucilaginibacter sp.]|uniref:lasso peptide biosynthesis B2 protein n=1 Tax=Mucilaginibacter sp. TaxID=1882438 RepID=UPI0028510C9D|nr:lasso peptide biosynthesis B2 protein [Mucilaginibacter sp.]MDR3697519.1 lasso peptide biosynthesis B2 protein [Mucilaginibacter sp.]
MKILRKINTYIDLPLETKLLFAEALFASAWVKLTLKFFPFARVMSWLGAVNHESATDIDTATLLTRQRIKRALVLCNRYALWPTECYTLSLTGKLLLKRRNINSTLYIGFTKDESGKYKGHAWLRANETYISGWGEAVGFTVHSMFS